MQENRRKMERERDLDLSRFLQELEDANTRGQVNGNAIEEAREKAQEDAQEEAQKKMRAQVEQKRRRAQVEAHGDCEALARTEIPSHNQSRKIDAEVEGTSAIMQLFNGFVSGRQYGVHTFRKADLHTFGKAAYCISQTARQWGRQYVFLHLEKMYDYTLQLQIDMGCPQHHGLTLKYFNVFLEKAASLLGWSCISSLVQ